MEMARSRRKLTMQSADEQVLEQECESCEQFKANIQKLEEEICDAGKLVECQEEKIGNLKREVSIKKK